MTDQSVVNAAVGILRRADGQVLVAQRPVGKSWAGWWEFPGGKIESGESPAEALKRELHEELGVVVIQATPWVTREFSYPERHVRLHFFIVREWEGEPHSRENQDFCWQDPAQPTVSPFLPANLPLLPALALPEIYAITNLDEMGEARFLTALDHVLASGVRLIQVREKSLNEEDLAVFAKKIMPRIHAVGGRVMINADPQVAKSLAADGVHLSSARLMQINDKPDGLICGASCHTVAELAHAAKIGCDFAVLAPVLSTRSHPDSPFLGWDEFGRLLRDLPIPVYALGGMTPSDIGKAWEQGAHGVAMQRAVWGI